MKSLSLTAASEKTLDNIAKINKEEPEDPTSIFKKHQRLVRVLNDFNDQCESKNFTIVPRVMYLIEKSIRNASAMSLVGLVLRYLRSNTGRFPEAILGSIPTDLQEKLEEYDAEEARKREHLKIIEVSDFSFHQKYHRAFSWDSLPKQTEGNGDEEEEEGCGYLP